MESHEALATPRLLLRRFREDDVAAFHEILKDVEVMRYWSTPAHRDVGETRQWVLRAIESSTRGDSDEFVVEHGHRVVGKAGLWRRNELGFVFARGVWGLGLASEAIRAVVDRAFARGSASIFADVDPRNTRALRLLERLGFRRVGTASHTWRVGEDWVDSVYLELRPGSYVLT